MTRVASPPALPALARPRPLSEPAAADATTVRSPQWAPTSRPSRRAEAAFPPANSYPTNANGTPLFRQADPSWSAVKLGQSGYTLGSAGCALTSVAMALSKVSCDPLTPRELGTWLDKRKGFTASGALDWDKAAAARKLKVERPAFKLANIDAALAEGRPVVLGVDYKKGTSGNGTTDHWICLTRREDGPDGKPVYFANDPGTGKEIRLVADARGKLVGDGTDALGHYKSSGELRIFVERDQTA